MISAAKQPEILHVPLWQLPVMTCYQNRLIPSLELAFFLQEMMNSLQGTSAGNMLLEISMSTG